jgi:GNAT superfamily N-acetyltransferase
MAATEALARIRLGPERAQEALRLSDEAGWNQTLDDWRFMLTHGTGFGIEAGGRLVATALLLPWGERVAWLSMVLVTAGFRRRGLATELVRRVMDEAGRRDHVLFLDATPAGARVYAPLGFEPVFGFRRLRGTPAPTRPPGTVRPMTEQDLERVTALDAGAFGAPRPALMRGLLRRSAGRAWVAEGGFVLARDGRRQPQIGPLAAPPELAPALIDAALTPGGPVSVDVPVGHPVEARLLALGLEEERSFTRMCQGGGSLGEPALSGALAGPELG